VIGVALVLSGCGSAQSRKASYISRGMQYLTAQNYDKARVEFSNAAQIDPQDAHVRYLLGQVAEKTGNMRVALGQYQAAIQQDPKLAEARAALGRLYLYGGLADKAMEMAETGLAINPNEPQLLTVRGGARAQLGDVAGALRDAQKAVQLAPSDEYAIALLASLDRRRGQLGEAVRVIQMGLQRLPDDVSLLSILADLRIAHQLARFFLQQKNVDEAQKTLQNAVSAFPDSTDAKLQLVGFLAAQRSRDQAATQIDQFLQQDPKNVPLKLALSGVLNQIGHNPEAEQVLGEVIAHARQDDPESVTARDRLAAMLLSRNDVAGATVQIAAVLKSSPGDNDALILQSQILLKSGNPTGAIDNLRSVLRDQPNAVPVMRMLATAYQNNGELGLAEETLRNAVQVSPQDAASRLALAQTLTNDGKAEQAEPLLEALGKEDPANVSVQQVLFRAQAAQKSYDAALATASNVERLVPNQAVGFYLHGLVEEAQRQTQAAHQDYEQALRIEPQAIEPLAALTRLDLQARHAQAAEARLNTLLTQYPNDAPAENLKAQLLQSQGDMVAAITTYQQTIQMAPDWDEGYQGLAQAQLRLGQTDAAVHTLQQGLERTHADGTLLIGLGKLYENLKRPDDAIALYEGVLAKDAKSVLAANDLAMLLVNYKHDAASLARAQQLADQLAAFSVPTVIDTRGWVKFKSGDFHGAESLLQQAVDRSPDVPELRYHLGMAQFRSGEAQAAQQNLAAAVSSARPFPGMDEARATLMQLQKDGARG
jgi:tetratricopeptide (TPR) repeat protein